MAEPGSGAARLNFHFIYKGGFHTPDSPPMRAPETVRLALYAGAKLICLYDPINETPVDSLRASDGSIAWLRIGSRVHKRWVAN